MGLWLGIAAFAAAAIFGVAWGSLMWLHRPASQLPRFALEDVGDGLSAGKIAELSGHAEMIRGGLGHSLARSIAASGEDFPIGTSFVLKDGAKVAIVSQGNWHVDLADAGRFVLEDARTNAGKTKHSASWFVSQGMLEARTGDYDPAEHDLQIRTPVARILLQNAEVGVKVSPSGAGEVWLRSGHGTIFWNDGRSRELSSQGMEFL